MIEVVGGILLIAILVLLLLSWPFDQVRRKK